ncbi:unnamed protein product [Rotaria socialis]|uniref:Uncharacterized protein n=1 Tax=Rotaria socialis TaxID=392032 RepID=A0A821PEU3_9BILA|nr:unnamed protein product [Rotaria socialis]
MDETLIRVLYGKPVPTILDTDIGTTYDNHLALIYILSCPSRFKSKTDCLFHNKYDRTRTDRSENIEFFQRFDIPMSLGRASEDTYGIFQYRWSKDYSLEKCQYDGGTIFSDGEQASADEMKKASMYQP